MRRILAVLLSLIFALTILCGCSSGNYIDKTAKGLSNYLIEANFDETNKTLSAVSTYEWKNNTENTFTELKFHFYPSVYKKDSSVSVVPRDGKVDAYVNGYSYGDAKIDYVKVDGADVQYTLNGADSTILTVPLGKEVYPNESVAVQIVYQVTLANIWHRLGYGDNTVNLANFYPILCYISNGEFVCDCYSSFGDPFVSDIANYSVSVTVPSNYTVAGTGKRTASTAEGDKTRYTFSAECVRDFAMTMSQKYQTIGNNVGKTAVTYYYFNDEKPAETLSIAVKALEYFNNLFGAYPYDNFEICQSDFCYGGMEYPQMVTVSATTQPDEYRASVVHEICHQWLYGLIGNDQYRNAWMDEGLTEFATLMFFEDHKEYNVTMDAEIAQMLKAYTTYVDVLSSYINNFDTSMNRSLDAYASEQEYVYISYVKGCLMFQDLYKTIGKARFEKALKCYFNKCKLTVAKPADMIECFETEYGAPLTEWFNAYLTGKDIISQVR